MLVCSVLHSSECVNIKPPRDWAYGYRGLPSLQLDIHPSATYHDCWGCVVLSRLPSWINLRATRINHTVKNGKTEKIER